MKFDDKIFVVTVDKIIEGTIFGRTTHKGVVTGYEILSGDIATKFPKKDIFIDKKKAIKALFLKKLKSDKEYKAPAEDLTGDRRWISDYKKHGHGQ